MGASSLAVAGIPTVVSAQEHDESDDHVQRVLGNPKVRSIREAVGGFDVKSAEKKEIEKGNLAMTGSWIETDLGTLVYVEPEEAEIEVQLKFADLAEKPQHRRRLPGDHRNVPKESEIILKPGSAVSLVRTVTAKEERKLTQAVDDSNNIVRAVYDSELGKYRVTTGDPDTDFQNAQKYHVNRNGRNRPTPTQEAEQIVTTQGCANSACASCALWAANRGLCYVSCASGQLYMCAACLFTNSLGLAVADCDTCFDKCL